MRELQRLQTQLNEIDKLLGGGAAACTRRAETVSAWSVAQQLDHLLLSMRAAFERILAGPEPVDARLSLIGRVLIGYGRLPRGRGKARKELLGRDRSVEELAQDVREVRALLERVRARPDLLARREPVIRHAFFGGLNARWAVRLLGVHNDHHFRIVRDILRAA